MHEIEICAIGYRYRLHLTISAKSFILSNRLGCIYKYIQQVDFKKYEKF